MALCSMIFSILLFPSLLWAQLNPSDAPWNAWSPHRLSEYEKIISTINLDPVATDTKNWDMLPSIFLQDAVASYTAGANISYDLEAIKKVHVDGTAGFITQHALSNFLVTIGEDELSANASYYAIATLFTNPQQNSGQYVNLYGYYNDELVKTTQGWRIKYLEYRFFGPGWTGNLSVLPPGHPMAPPSSFEPPNSTKLKM